MSAAIQVFSWADVRRRHSDARKGRAICLPTQADMPPYIPHSPQPPASQCTVRALAAGTVSRYKTGPRLAGSPCTPHTVQLMRAQAHGTQEAPLLLFIPNKCSHTLQGSVRPRCFGCVTPCGLKIHTPFFQVSALFHESRPQSTRSYAITTAGVVWRARCARSPAGALGCAPRPSVCPARRALGARGALAMQVA